MCGIIGLVVGPNDDAAPELIEALHLLQHRGQDACGISVVDTFSSQMLSHKGSGLVAEVFRDGKAENFPGATGIGHLRYPTAGSRSDRETQPLQINIGTDISLVHNGNLTNLSQLRTSLGKTISPCTVDSEILLNILAKALKNSNDAPLNSDTISAALLQVYEQCQGAFSCIVSIAGYGLVGWRDSHGLKPLILGERSRNDANNFYDYIFSSESFAAEKLGFNVVRDVRPGEAIFIPHEASKSSQVQPLFRQIFRPAIHSPDIFEFVYFARPESVIDGISVYHSRKQMGSALGNVIQASWSEEIINSIDSVMAVPETSIVCAIALSLELKKPYVNAITRNSHILRTFIQSGHTRRLKSINRKLNFIEGEFKDKNILIVDDSIVRGGTSRRVVRMAREAGARKVFFASCSPEIRYKHIHGIDLANREDLIAYNQTNAEMRRAIGCDELVFLPLKDLIQACLMAREDIRVSSFETGVFSGSYCT